MKLKDLKETKLTDLQREEIKQILDDEFIENGYEIREDGRIDFLLDPIFSKDIVENGIPKLKFGVCKRGIHISNAGLKTFKGDWFPEEAETVYLRDNELSSFEGLDGNQKVEEYLLMNNKFTDLHNIHKHIKSARYMHFNYRGDGNDITSKILGLTMIKGLENIDNVDKQQAQEALKHLKPDHNDGRDYFIDKNTGEVFERMYVAMLVVTSFLGESGAMSKAQRMLLDMDLDEFAEL